MSHNTLLNIGQVYNLADNIAISNGAAATFVALPTRSCAIGIQVSFGVAPSALDLDIEVSNDGLAWAKVMDFTEIGGSQTEIISAAFLRYNVNSHTGGSGMTISVIPKAVTIGVASSGTDLIVEDLTVQGNAQIDGTLDVTGVTTLGTTNLGTTQVNGALGVVGTIQGTQVNETSTVTTTTSTGNQDNFDIGVAKVLRCNNASLLTIRGIIAPAFNGQRLIIVSVGAGQVDIANENANSTAANRIINNVTGTISLAAGVGRAILEYDGTTARWRVIQHEQGDWITPTFAAGDYTGNGSMTWTVASGDVVAFKYYLRGRQLFVDFFLNATTVGGTPNTTLLKTIPGGFITSGTYRSSNHVVNNGVIATGLASGVNGDTTISFQLAAGGNWTASTDNTGIQGEVIVPVQ